MKFLTEYKSSENKKSALIFEGDNNGYVVEMYMNDNKINTVNLPDNSIHYAKDLASNYVEGVGAFNDREFLTGYNHVEGEELING